MLKEKIVYKDDLPVNALIADIQNYPIHFHDDPEVVFVLKGSINLRVGYCNYSLKQDDVFIVNDREMHSFEHTDEPNMVLMMQLKPDYFSNYYDNFRSTFFITNTDDVSEIEQSNLRNLIIRIIRELLCKGADYQHNVIENTHNLISCLFSDFQYFSVEGDIFINDPRKRKNKQLAIRLNRITTFLYDNYAEKITLNQLAEREHLSVYYLSHVIKESTGLSFQDLLSFIRVEQSERLLLGTRKKIGKIASETGFSAIRYYIKHFEKWYGMHPEKYRSEYTGKVSDYETPAILSRYAPPEILTVLRARSKHGNAFVSKTEVKREVINVDLSDRINTFAQANKPGKLLQNLLDMNTSNIAPAMEPYRMLDQLNENVLYDEDNYLITSPSKWPDRINSLSILFFNFDDNFKRTVSASNLQETFDIILDYNAETDMLIKLHGLAGNFSVSRYKLKKENIISGYEEFLTESDKNSRVCIANKWKSMAFVEFSKLTSTGILNIHIALQGFSAELILIDRI